MNLYKNHFQQALNVLTKIAADSSLRYAIQLITSSALSAKKAKRTEVTTQDIRKVYNLFLDEKRSTDYLKEYQKQESLNTQNNILLKLTYQVTN